MVDAPSEYALASCDLIFRLGPVGLGCFGFEVELGLGCSPGGFCLLPGLAIALTTTAVEVVLLAGKGYSPITA